MRNDSISVGHTYTLSDNVSDNVSDNLNEVTGRSSEIECSDLVVKTLEELGVRSAFGIPGGALSNIFNSLSKSKLITTVLTQHETGAAYMAVGRTLMAESRGELGLCFATSGPGITNLITGVASAFEERIPIFVVTGNVATTLIGRGAAQDAHASGINAVRMLDSITCQSLTITNPAELELAIRALYAEALRTRLPVHLNIPVDVATARIPLSPSTKLNSIEFSKPSLQFEGSNARLVSDSIHQFITAQRPLIFAGNGVKTCGCGSLLRAVSEALQLPVVLTSHAKGVLPEDHPLYFGNFGFAASQRSTTFIETYNPDSILFIGTRLTEPSSAGWSPLLAKPKTKIHVDLDGSQLNRIYPVEFPICADMSDYLSQLLARGAEFPSVDRQLSRISTRLSIVDKADDSMSLDGPINPASLMRVIDLWLPPESVIFSDIGNSMAWILHSLPIREKQQLYIPLGLGSMGSGLCGAIGAKSVLSDRPVICFVGDCSMLMHGTEIFTALNAGIGVKIFVLNDGGHGMVDHGHKLLGLTNVNVRFDRKVDFKKFSQSLNVPGYSVSRLPELASLPFEQILTSKGPAIIEIMIDEAVVPPILARARVLGQNNRRTAS